MLSPTEAKDRLAPDLIDAADRHDLAPLQVERVRSSKLPKRLLALTLGLLGRDAAGEPVERSSEEEAALVTQRDQLKPADRLKVLTALCGAAGPLFADAMAWHAQPGRAHAESGAYQVSPLRYAESKPIDDSGLWATAATLGRYVRPEAPTAEWLAVWASHLSNAIEGYHYELYAHQFAGVLVAAIDKGGPAADAVFEIVCDTLRGEHDIAVFDRHVIPTLLAAARPEGWKLVEKTLLAAQRQEGLRDEIVGALPGAAPDAFAQLLHLIREQNLSRFTSVWSELANLFGFSSIDHGGMVNDMTPAKIRHCLEVACELLDESDADRIASTETEGERLWFALWSIGLRNVEAARQIAGSRLDDATDEVRFICLQFLRFAAAQAGPQAAQLVDDPNPQVADAAYWLVRDGFPDGGSVPVEMEAQRFEAIELYLSRLPKTPAVLDPIVWPWTAWTVDRESVISTLIYGIGDLPPTRLLPHLDALNTYQRSYAIVLLSAQEKWDNETRDALLDLAADRSADVAIEGIKALCKKATRKPPTAKRSADASEPVIYDLSADEVDLLEGLLTRTSAAVRQTVFEALTSLPGDQPLESASRLLASGKAPQRLGGLEVLRQLTEAGRFGQQPRELAAAFAESRRKLSKAEQTQIEAVTSAARPEDKVETVFGLIDPQRLTQPKPPAMPTGKDKIKLVTPATTRLIQSLGDLIAKNGEAVAFENPEADEPIRLLAEMDALYADPRKKTKAAFIKAMPLADLWLTWNEKRPKATRDADGMELVRAEKLLNHYEQARSWYGKDTEEWFEKVGPAVREFVVGTTTAADMPESIGVISSVIDFLIEVQRRTDGKAATAEADFDFTLRAWRTMINLVDRERFVASRQKAIDEAGTQYEYQQRRAREEQWQSGRPLRSLTTDLRSLLDEQPAKTRKTCLATLWPEIVWMDRTDCHGQEQESYGHRRDLAPRSYAADAATLDDLLHVAVQAAIRFGRRGNGLLHSFTTPGAFDAPKTSLGVALTKSQTQHLAEATDRLVGRLLELELARGEAPTDAARVVSAVNAVVGFDRMRAMLLGLDKKGFARTNDYSSGNSRRESLTGLIKVSRPAPGDTVEEFVTSMRQAVQSGELPEDRLLQLAFLAPQWVRHVEAYFAKHGRWDGLSEAVYWFLAHMRGWGMGDKTEAAAEAAGYEAEEVADDADYKTRRAAKSGWDRLIGERTPIPDDERAAGAIDVDWFHAVFSRLKRAKWDRLSEAARFADNAQQAKRAKFVADTLAGRIDRKRLIDDIATKRLKDSVRLLGLLPLAKGAKQQKDIRDRYEVLAEYQRYARTLSGLTRPDAEQAVGIGMDNLARLAGYPDPLRMHWALEADALADLASGPVVVSEGTASFRLELDEMAQPHTTSMRGTGDEAKPLKSLPKELKANKKTFARVTELRERSKQIKRLATRSRQALEEAMIRGDGFTGTELKGLGGHAVVWPMISRLVLLGEGIAGYPDKKGRVLRLHDGTLEPVKAKEQLRIAHPHDLLERGDWSEFQRECLAAERIQPFKQVFRELYTLTPAERKGGGKSEGRRKDDHVSRRYAGQQVQPSQAMALFGSRGWSTSDGIWKTDHREKITAEVYGELYHGSVAQNELPTVEGIVFRRVGEWEAMPLHEVPPRLFSETMRDVDLAVSVAHAGGVDPEATASTVEMRAALLSETCLLLGLDNVNVEVKKARAIIEGHFAKYSVHLGSGTVHRLPGGSVCLVPVHSQHRGRLFLPFADNDPRTAEVMSKTLLLARDTEIKDPVLLDQIRVG